MNVLLNALKNNEAKNMPTYYLSSPFNDWLQSQQIQTHKRDSKKDKKKLAANEFALFRCVAAALLRLIRGNRSRFSFSFFRNQMTA